MVFPTYSISPGLYYCVEECFSQCTPTYQELVLLYVQAKCLLYGCLMSPWVWWYEELESSEMENI